MINENGQLKSDEELMSINTNNGTNVIHAFMIKNNVVKKLRKYDLSIAPYVKLQHNCSIIFRNKRYEIQACTSKLLYNMLKQKEISRGYMESVYAQKCGFENDKQLWHTIYLQKLVDIGVPKLREFNLKLLHNILPCGYVLNKWEKHVNNKCPVCDEDETVKHMLFDCNRIREIWRCISDAINVPVN